MVFWLSGAHALDQVEAKNFAGDKFVFPDAIQGASVNVVFLAISVDQDNGTEQDEVLNEWQKALSDAGVFNADVLLWRFPVIENPPFFVKGIIRRAIAKSYADLVPPEQGAVLFVKDIQGFSDAAGVELDGRPTVILLSEQQQVIQVYRGEVNDADVSSIVGHLAGVSKESPQAGT
jgi:hypothetical protein